MKSDLKNDHKNETNPKFYKKSKLRIGTAPNKIPDKSSQAQFLMVAHLINT